MGEKESVIANSLRELLRKVA